MQHPTVEGLANWLESLPGETTYSYVNNLDCLLCRYFKSVGLDVESMWASTWLDASGVEHDLPSGCRGPLNMTSSEHPHTYSAALERAKAHLNTNGGD